MTIAPEVIPPSSSAGFNAVRFMPRWIFYGVIGLGVLFVVAIIKMFFPLIIMGLTLGFILKQAKTN